MLSGRLFPTGGHPKRRAAFVSCVSQQPDMAALKKTVEEYNAATQGCMLSGNMEKVLTYYEEGAMEMPPNMSFGPAYGAIVSSKHFPFSRAWKF